MAALSAPNSPSSPSLKQKLKSTLCLSPFRKYNHHHYHRHVSFSISEKDTHQIHDHQVVQEEMNIVESHEDIKGNQTSFLSCIRKRYSKHHSMSADFHYDATSYALNFDEGQGSDDSSYKSSESPLKNFTARLPPSPNRDFHILNGSGQGGQIKV